jgi:enamine deaminase RidA (YjgF/YER057c/UK114 family)
MIERLQTNHRMSKIVKHNGVVYLCGQVGKAEGGITEQALECLSRVDQLLAEAGSSKERILQATIWLADISEKMDMDKIWDAWVPEGYGPARACGEARLSKPELRVEIIITASYETLET